MLVLGIEPDQEITIGPDIIIHFNRTESGRPRVCIRAPKSMKIDRRERTDVHHILEKEAEGRRPPA